MTNPVKSVRQNMAQETADKLVPCQGGFLPPTFFAVISETEPYPAVLYGKDAIVANGYLVGVAADVANHLLRCRQWPLGIDHPIAAYQNIEPFFEKGRLGKVSHLRRNHKRFGGMELLQSMDEFAAKDLRQSANGKEKLAFIFRLQPLIVNGQTAAGDNEMKMEMFPQLSTPGVQNSEKTDLGAKVLGVAAELEKGRAGGIEEDIVNRLLVVSGDRMEFVREGEDYVVVRDRQQVSHPGPDPFAPGYALAFRAVPIPAGVVGVFLVAAVRADINVITEFTGPALFDIPHHAVLFRGEPMILAIGPAVCLKNIRYFQFRSMKDLLPGDCGQLYSSSPRRESSNFSVISIT